MYSLSIRPKAKQDLKKIWRYTYDHWGERQATAYVTELGRAMDTITDNPNAGIAVDHVREGYRLYHVKHHAKKLPRRCGAFSFGDECRPLLPLKECVEKCA